MTCQYLYSKFLELFLNMTFRNGSHRSYWPLTTFRIYIYHLLLLASYFCAYIENRDDGSKGHKERCCRFHHLCNYSTAPNWTRTSECTKVYIKAMSGLKSWIKACWRMKILGILQFAKTKDRRRIMCAPRLVCTCWFLYTDMYIVTVLKTQKVNQSAKAPVLITVGFRLNSVTIISKCVIIPYYFVERYQKKNVFCFIK